MVKAAWRVEPKPTGQFRSFQERGWPSLQTEDGNALFRITCDEAYHPWSAKRGLHEPLTLLVACGNPPELRAEKGRFTWKRLYLATPLDSLRKVRQFKTLAEVKEYVKDFMRRHPDHDYGLD